MIPGFKEWKAAFDEWENTTAKYTEEVLKSPALLDPAGAAISSVMRAKAVADRTAERWWGALGLPTKRDQERTLHLLHHLESKILDLEEQLADANRKLEVEAKKSPAQLTAASSTVVELDAPRSTNSTNVTR